MSKSERVPTGVDGFDPLIEGGIPRGSLVVLEGNPGAGKSILSAKYLEHGALRYGEPGLYISFGENREFFESNMKRFSMDFEALERQGKFLFMDLLTVNEKGMEAALETMMAGIDTMKAQRLVLDSFTAMEQAYTRGIDARILLHSILGRICRQKGITTIMISERSQIPGTSSSMEEYVADGVMAMELSHERGLMTRKLRVTKMRGTKLSAVTHRYDIGEHGLRVFPEPRLKLVERAFNEKVSTGIEGLDKMLNGGLFKGSITLVMGVSGTGKTTAALHFAMEAAMRSEKVLYVSYEEPAEQLARYAQGFGWPIKEYIDKGLVRISSYYPDSLNFDEHIDRIDGLIREHRPQRFVVDSLTALNRTISESEQVMFVKWLESRLRAEGITALYAMIREQRSPNGEDATTSLVDNIISLRDVELESALERGLVIFKAKGTACDRGIREFEITQRGIRVLDRFVGMEQVLAGSPRRSITEDAARVWGRAFGAR
jgi:circadian clock protein KaiC